MGKNLIKNFPLYMALMFLLINIETWKNIFPYFFEFSKIFILSFYIAFKSIWNLIVYFFDIAIFSLLAPQKFWPYRPVKGNCWVQKYKNYINPKILLSPRTLKIYIIWTIWEIFNAQTVYILQKISIIFFECSYSKQMKSLFGKVFHFK